MSWISDRKLLYVTLFLIGLGLVQVYSSSFVFATDSYKDGLFFFRRQLIFSIIGIGLLVVVAKLPWRVVHMSALASFLVVIGLLVLTLTTDLGLKVGGAKRWMWLPFGLRFEPGEVFKILLPFWISFIVFFHRKGTGVAGHMLLLVPPLLGLFVLIKQPDFGTFTLSLMAVFILSFVWGLPYRWMAATALAGIPAFYFLIVRAPYRLSRFNAFLDPWADADEGGFQLIQSLLSFYKGGFSGVGLGQGQGKLLFLPEAHNDFTAAVLGEETGFLGIALVLLLYGYFILRFLRISFNAETETQKLVALGLTLVFSLSIFINFGVALGLVPTKGLALPFLSYGGSSLLSCCVAVGVLLNIDRVRKNKEHKERFKVIS